MRMNLYGQGRHIVVVDGIPLTGFAEGDFISIKADGNAAQRTQGGDGPAMNLTVAQGGQVTLSLLPTSPAIGLMYQIRGAQLVNPRLFNVVVMTGVDEVITAAGCAFGDLPQLATGGPTMQARQFVFEALKIIFDPASVEAIIGGAVLGGVL